MTHPTTATNIAIMAEVSIAIANVFCFSVRSCTSDALYFTIALVTIVETPKLNIIKGPAKACMTLYRL